jgi:hypothetical protein
MGNLSFREKSLLGSLLGLMAVSGYYAYRVGGALLDGGSVSGEYMAGLGIQLLVGLVVLEIVYQAVIAGFSPDEANEADDERDRQIAARAGNVAGTVLAVLMAVLVVHVMGNARFENTTLISPLVISHLILLSLVVYQVVDYLYRLIAYRRGY